jgi:hypothetical protein
VAGGDLGIPALGSGSHAGAISSSYEVFLDDKITQGGSQMAAEIRSATMSADNGYEKAGIAGTTEQAIHVGQQELTFTATVAGSFSGHENLTDHLQGNEFDIAWEFDGGTVTLTGCALTSPGEVGPSAGDVVSTQDTEFSAKSISFTAN